MIATVIRHGDRVTVEFIPEERDCNCLTHHPNGKFGSTAGHVDDRFGKTASITFAPERFGKHKGRLGLAGADLNGWRAWVFLVSSGLAESIDLGPATMGDTLILLSEEALS